MISVKLIKRSVLGAKGEISTMFSWRCARSLTSNSEASVYFGAHNWRQNDTNKFSVWKKMTDYSFLMPTIFNRALRSRWLAFQSSAAEAAPMDLRQVLVPDINSSNSTEESLFGDESALLMSSTLKKRAMKMNKHKLKKRRKSLRMNTKRSRG